LPRRLSCGRLRASGRIVMKRAFLAGLAIAPFILAGAGFAQQDANPHPQEKARAEKLTQAPGGSQTSVPQHTPPATPTQATTSTQQPPMVKEMNQQGKARIEKEGK
jgi:hypothetical protein